MLFIHTRRFGLLAFLILVSACSSPPAPKNPLSDPALLPPTAFRAVARRDQSLTITPVVDNRSQRGGGTGLFDQRLSIPVTELVRSLLGRQISLASLFSSVRLEDSRDTGDSKDSDLVMNVELLDFDARETGITTLPTAHATIEMRVKVATRSGDALLEKRYIQRLSQDGSMVSEPDAFALGCEALQLAVAEVLADLDHLDLGSR